MACVVVSIAIKATTIMISYSLLLQLYNTIEVVFTSANDSLTYPGKLSSSSTKQEATSCSLSCISNGRGLLTLSLFGGYRIVQI
jgi:hypothetical protein